MHDFVAWVLVCVILVCVIWILSGLCMRVEYDDDETETVLMSWLFEYDGHKFTNWAQLQGVIISEDVRCMWDMLSVDKERGRVVGIVYARTKDIAQDETTKAYEDWLKEVTKK